MNNIYKMISVFFAGCILIGIGIGITFVELKDWNVVDENPDLLNMPQETFTQELAFTTERPTDIRVNWYRHNFTYENISVEERSDCTDNIKIEITYRGIRPGVSASSNGNESTMYHLWIFEDGTDILHDYDIVKSMFENKLIYKWNNITHIDKIVLYTAKPENLKLVH